MITIISSALVTLVTVASLAKAGTPENPANYGKLYTYAKWDHSLTAQVNKFCVDNIGAYPENIREQNPIQAWPCIDNNPNQKWEWVRYKGSDNCGYIRLAGTYGKGYTGEGFCIDRFLDGPTPKLWPCNWKGTQNFCFNKRGQLEHFTYKQDRCLDVTGTVYSDGLGFYFCSVNQVGSELRSDFNQVFWFSFMNAPSYA
ncbi:UNVERIFIED_CONTAM: hypothetical protein HDU68_001901 [Siphonaria sp. JEL0065]|nr:hypothetical protein HDU68_001901 [Siphonaria sp. JEL0065]